LNAICSCLIKKERAFEWFIGLELSRSNSTLFTKILGLNNDLHPENWDYDNIGWRDWNTVEQCVEIGKLCIIPEKTDTKKAGAHKIDVAIPLYKKDDKMEENDEMEQDNKDKRTISGWIFIQCATKDQNKTNQNTSNNFKARGFFDAITIASSKIKLPKYYVYANLYPFEVSAKSEQYPANCIVLQPPDYNFCRMPFNTLQTVKVENPFEAANIVKRFQEFVIANGGNIVYLTDSINQTIKRQKLQ